MDTPGWLSQRQADVPAGDWWLGERERSVLADLRSERRRSDWRLGRWTVKAALACWLDTDAGGTETAERIEVLAAADGAPEAWVDGQRSALSISLSHRAGRALAVVQDPPGAVGCDVEVIEPRSDAFIREWLAAAEQRVVDRCEESRRALIANLIWTAKEAAAKVRREGLRLDVRSAVVTLLDGPAPSTWQPLRVDWSDGAGATHGWWCTEPGWVMTIAAEPSPAAPRELARRAVSRRSGGSGDVWRRA